MAVAAILDIVESEVWGEQKSRPTRCQLPHQIFGDLCVFKCFHGFRRN